MDRDDEAEDTGNHIFIINLYRDLFIIKWYFLLVSLLIIIMVTY